MRQLHLCLEAESALAALHPSAQQRAEELAGGFGAIKQVRADRTGKNMKRNPLLDNNSCSAAGIGAAWEVNSHLP